MKESFLKIAETARKESHAGYGDYAVFGGFSAFVLDLLKDDEEETAVLLKTVVRHYGESNLVSRKAIIGMVEKIIGDIAETEKPEPDTLSTAKTPESDVLAGSGEKTSAVPAQAADIPLCELSGIGPKTAKLLGKLEIETVNDLCEYFPRRHEDRRFITPIGDLVNGETALISGVVAHAELNRIRSNLQIVKAKITDGTGFLTVVWFNQAWLKQQLSEGRELTVYGKAEVRGGYRGMTATEYELKANPGGMGILPVYGLTAGINQKTVRKLTAAALERQKGQIEEFLPRDFCEKYGLVNRETAVMQYHFPPDFEALARSRRRLVFEEFFLFRLAFFLQHNGESHVGRSLRKGSQKDFFRLLPFTPTGAQERVIGEIYRDMAAPKMMNRLVEGDVGSGKTVVAAAAIWRCFQSGHQSVLMAPTEILAEQHFQSLTAMFGTTDMKIALLTGSTKAAEKKKLTAELACGAIDLLIGTHAVIEGRAVFKDLALVVIDEQHRFGVNQRNALFMKGATPDLLVMTATPIPRTLAMTVFSGLDISLLDELPPGRKPVKTMVISDNEEERAMNFIRRHVEAGHQCYIVCPLVEESEKLDVEAATRLYDRLRMKDLKGLALGLVHGKMKSAEKEAVLTKFRKNEISVLVSTTVIEVGIDVPNATVMLIRDADRFGLAQLHQIRGRIGRGEALSTCLLQSSAQGEISRARLQVMADYQDGFKIAEEDLKLRGPGDFFGIRQHGIPEMKLADLYCDHELLTEAAGAVDKVIAEDHFEEDEKWAPTKARINKLYRLNEKPQQ